MKFKINDKEMSIDGTNARIGYESVLAIAGINGNQNHVITVSNGSDSYVVEKGKHIEISDGTYIECKVAVAKAKKASKNVS